MSLFIIHFIQFVHTQGTKIFSMPTIHSLNNHCYKYHNWQALDWIRCLHLNLLHRIMQQCHSEVSTHFISAKSSPSNPLQRPLSLFLLIVLRSDSVPRRMNWTVNSSDRSAKYFLPRASRASVSDGEHSFKLGTWFRRASVHHTKFSLFSKPTERQANLLMIIS